ncbi:unnamed protein product [Coccothraustes coccothraustes]
MHHCFLREGERERGTASAPKPSPLSPADMGNGLQTYADGSGEGQRSLPHGHSTFVSVPACPPPPAQKVVRAFLPVGPPWGGLGMSRPGCGAGAPPFPVLGAGGRWAVPAAVPGLSGAAPAASPCPAPGGANGGGRGWASPRIRFRAASGK